ncbi:hypothetical protein BKA82DRAFT_20565 [Pisolithus tinctorius]|uniref:Uncharacterized protein n=2 Tax=Pisolithus tinctorius Marx 270 TaxID=870435 RepID=A0A0C3PBG8_PISTI|nr:hypothetical protein BKA82DRAFT_20565 [Pisolithus tinctorius]KIO11040.1 hypothetical protein M404DRAFT_20565 [Pisolithus tinctorius Marx 270]
MQLHCIGFIPHEDPGTFGFLDPHHVICAIHLIPAFKKENDEDWVYLFVDRDMLMCFHGGSIGHKSTCTATNVFKQDCDDLDRTCDFSTTDNEEHENITGMSTIVSPDDEIQAEDDEESLEMEEYGYDGLEQVEDESRSVGGMGDDIDGPDLEEDEPELGLEDGEDEVFPQDELVWGDYGEL